MSRAPASRRRVLSVVVVAALVVSFTPAAFGGAAPRRAAASVSSTAPGSVVSGSEQTSAKRLASSLRSAADTGGTKKVDVLVMASKGAKAPAYLETPLRVKLKGDTSNDFYAGKVRADRLVKLATSKGVLFVADNGKKAPPPIPDVKKRSKADILAANAKMKAAMKAATKSGVMKRFADSVNGAKAPAGSAQGSGGTPTGWHDVGPTHNSAAAWANGFTGSGVKVAVADDGLDFGHPDLQGTQAYIHDAGSPYDGWPMAFDPFSTYLYALDQTFGTSYMADGVGWFSSTEATMAGTTSGTWEGHTYTLPHTSKSGVYHVGKLWDENLAAYWYSGDFPSILVADEHTAGVYDTVYVDLDDDRDFTDDKKCTKNDPISYTDFVDKNGNPGTDGYADLSGGMLYWISDGTHHPPMADVEFDSTGWKAPGSGDLVCMVGAYDQDSDHGTLCGSNAAGQGRIDGESIAGEYPSFKGVSPWTTGGIVQGAGKNAGLVAISDVYNNFEVSTLMAYDFVAYGSDGVADTGDEVQVMSNSYGESGTDNDEWDYPSRYVSSLNESVAPNTSFLFSTGNGGPGYGTNTPPSPSTGIGVGASTQMGADGGWDSIDTLSQVTYGDVIPFSNRGPSAMGHSGPAIVADGAFASGAEVLSLANGNGWTAWEIWGGTSRSCPVAAGNMTLIYQAFRGKNGRWPTYSEARDLMASGATDLNYDTIVQGSGSVNADRSTRLAAGLGDGGVLSSPSIWYPGSYRGLKAPAFQQVLHPGESDSTTLEVSNPSPQAVDVDVSDSWMQRSGTVTMSVILNPANESPYDFNRPDLLRDLTPLIPAGAELMVVRAVLPYSEFDADSDYAAENSIRLLTYDWTDRDSSGGLWTDSNRNGAVNASEIEANEYMRFTYSNAVSTSLENRVQKPLDRAHDGVYLGIQHQTRNGAPVHVTLEISFWNRTDMPWLGTATGSFSVPAGGSRDLPVFISVPGDAPLGTYEGEFRLRSDSTTVTVVPVVVTVAGTGTDISYGGATPYEQLQDTGKVLGYTDWGWRAEAGDWRFFTTDVPDDTPLGPGSLRLAHTTWSGMPTDLDTLIYGPQAHELVPSPSSFFGPYDLGFKGGSPNTNIHDGVWTFDTATGSTEDWVTGPLVPGLNQLMIHNVLYDGASVGTTFSGETGQLNADPVAADIVDTAAHHDVDFSFSSSLDLPGFEAEAFGLARPWSSVGTALENTTWTHEFNVAHAAYIEASTASDASDIDLYVQRWNGASWVTLGASESVSGNENVRINAPADGLYRMAVYGFSVPEGTDTFGAFLTIPQGNDITVTGLPSGPVSKGTTVTLRVSFSKDRTSLDARDGVYQGVLSCGPTGAGSALQLPISLSYPFRVDSTSPSDGATGVPTGTFVTAVFSKHVETDTLTPDSFYLMRGPTKVTGTVSYDPLTATARLHAPLSPETTYTAVLTTSVVAADGATWGGYQWSFRTGRAPAVLPTSITIRTTATSVRTGAIPILSGAVTPNTMIGKNIVVYVKKPGKTYWSYSSNRTVYNLGGKAAWQYKYYFRSGMVKGYYVFKAVVPAWPGFLASTSATTVSIRLR